MPQVIKQLTTEEIQQLTKIQETKANLIEKYGVLEYKLQTILSQKDLLNKELIKLNEYELQIGNDLQKSYGDGIVDINKGEFTSST